MSEAHFSRETVLFGIFWATEKRVVYLSGLAVGVAAVAALVAVVLVKLIAFVTNLAFFGRFSLVTVSPAGHHLGYAVVLVPVIGGLIVGVMARYGSAAIRGHGIPEAMEQVLLNESRIPARVTWLKPLSAAIAIGTGGPFGAKDLSSLPAAPLDRWWDSSFA